MALSILKFLTIQSRNSDEYLFTVQVRWAQITHDWMERLWKTPDGGKLGLIFICFHLFSDDHTFEAGLALVSSTRLNHSPVPPPW